ncbi:MAG: DUF6787 family protein [bacterium]
MKNFKERWEITKNWQLLYPIFGTLVLLYSGFKLATLITPNSRIFQLVIGLLIFAFFLWITLRLFKLLEKRWIVSHRWKIIRIFIVFAITGSMSVMITRPLFNVLGFTSDTFTEIPGGKILYIFLRILFVFPIYKVLLVFFGWIFGEYNFFFNFALKMLKRIGFKNWVERLESK